ncbi:glycosyl transferase [Burkholderia pseudomultivorans]|uniref:glycosyltransferase n=1 Tax=Burkholderia pseudomultivorans TaxID=1207504 RepID=UPI0007524FB5|nr:glycosyltransferase [Burkholderia pseudomultivorans]KWI50821.1 glycosyl transferase [Burkholderia pseudomultivorans]
MKKLVASLAGGPEPDTVDAEAAPADTLGQEVPLRVPLMDSGTKFIFQILALCWFVALAIFWRWWLRDEHYVDAFRFGVNCFVLFWTTFIPGYFIFIIRSAVIPNPEIAVPRDWRVAMVVTKAPSEPFAIVRTTLLAMLDQTYPHDTWLADEDPTPETLEWCRQHGVRVSTRRGVADYHRTSWPRRTRCKEGNLAYFYDTYGYDNYDFVSQLDADHVPTRTYLEEMLRPFVDPAVGYVSAPSICDSNAAESWSARGRVNVEGPLHGTMQAGYAGGLAPLCIGSHYAVRCRALREIGGLGPELAEDHSTTMIFNAKGWRGMHALNAIANGEGPRTFADLATQEFQWSKSVMIIMLRYTRHYFGGLPLKLKAQFLFCQLWYPLCALAMAGSVVIPVVALLTGRVWAHVDYLSYLTYALPLAVLILCVVTWATHATQSCRPLNTKLLSWEGLSFVFARWPWVVLGCASAIVDCLRGKEFAFKVTPKGGVIEQDAPLRVVAPYLLISMFCSGPVVAVENAHNAAGFYLFSTLTSILYLVIAAVVAVNHGKEQGLAASTLAQMFFSRLPVRNALFVFALAMLLAGIGLRAPQGWRAVTWRSDVPELLAPAPGQPVKQPALGAYDPDSTFSADANLAFDHVFVSWNAPDLDTQIDRAYRDAQGRHRSLMVTVEPWALDGSRKGALLDDIAQGRYDARIAATCSALAALQAPVFVRWGHEMETDTGRYPWAIGDASGYVDAYRRVVTACRAMTDKLRFVWSPAGNRNLDDYFPGRGYADVIGLSVFDCPRCAVWPAGGRSSAASVLRVKYARVADYGLPVMVTELGVDGSDARKRDELDEFQRSLWRYPLLKAVLYFNAVDTPGAWPAHYVPDWRIEPAFLPAEVVAK